jgi:hypothetical protein
MDLASPTAWAPDEGARAVQCRQVPAPRLFDLDCLEETP